MYFVEPGPPGEQSPASSPLARVAERPNAAWEGPFLLVGGCGLILLSTLEYLTGGTQNPGLNSAAYLCLGLAFAANGVGKLLYYRNKGRAGLLMLVFFLGVILTFALFAVNSYFAGSIYWALFAVALAITVAAFLVRRLRRRTEQRP
jgi:O-antigen/teichoic acid export membrane protein